jgi:hypothetical protein
MIVSHKLNEFRQVLGIEIGRGPVAFLRNSQNVIFVRTRWKLLLVRAKIKNILKEGTKDMFAALNDKAWDTKSNRFGSLAAFWIYARYRQ